MPPPDTERIPAEDLFRSEVMSASRERFGAPFKASRVSAWLTTGFLASVMAGGAVFLATGTYTRRETVSGTLVPTSSMIAAAAARPGTVSRVFVSEGDRVHSGAPLFAVSTDTSIAGDIPGSAPEGLGALTLEAAAQEADAVRMAAAVQRDISAERAREVSARREGLISESKALSGSLALQQDRERLAQQSVEAARTLADKGLFPLVQLRQREEAWIAARQSRAAIERELARTEAAVAQVHIEARRTRGEARMAELDASRALAQIAERRASSRAGAGLVVVAPEAGRVATLHVRPGAQFEQGRAGAYILPEGATLEAVVGSFARGRVPSSRR